MGYVDISDGVQSGLERYYQFDDDQEHIIDISGNAEQGHDLHLPLALPIVVDTTAPAADVQGAIGFIDTIVADGLFLATAMAFLPDGRMIANQQNGIIQSSRIRPGSIARRQLTTISVRKRW